MGHKVNPIGFRIGKIYDWRSQWFSDRDYKENLRQDDAIRRFILEKHKESAISKITIGRRGDELAINVHTARPGVIIGRGGSGIEEMKAQIARIANRPEKNISVNIKEIRKPESTAAVVARSIVEQLEKRMPFRRVMKQALDRTWDNGVKGVKIMVAGRLNGSEMSRTEWAKKGEIPLQTIRADIDYAYDYALASYGTLGVKVWIYKGEKFGIGEEEEEKEEEQLAGKTVKKLNKR